MIDSTLFEGLATRWLSLRGTVDSMVMLGLGLDASRTWCRPKIKVLPNSRFNLRTAVGDEFGLRVGDEDERAC